ncbi:glycosyltransferase [Microbacterium invictum]|uniref:Glycosyltransferase involved in cell wall biosynthesis n=1 Tax=Microbacterium invictum TaxID=515415 RepID=A0AA40SPT7_9MICO|nr:MULTISPECIES: glycosyltransferase [Microbacterium]MBB4140040.1 glycosyltransferase involved in cell wall biosynthesis [Microbacterium invictum]
MRVLVHLNSLELGGTQINAVDFAVAARAFGVDSILLGARDTVPAGPSLLDFAERRGIAIETYEPKTSILARGRQVREIAKRHRAELVHVYGSWGGGARPTYWGFACIGRRPWVQTVYEMEVSPKIKRHMPLVVGTGYLIDDLRDRPAPTILISPPVDTDADRPDVASGEVFRTEYDLEGDLLVIVSRLDASMKSLPIGVAIEAMRDLADVATLVVVGTGDDAPRLRAMAARVNESVGRAAVRCIGAMADPRPAYAASDIMLGMGGSAARSLAAGKPLVVQGEAGWSQLFEESTAETLARNSYWSAEEVVAAVERLVGIVRPLLEDPSRRSELGDFGRRFAVARFGLTAMSHRLADFYRVAATSYGARRWVADLAPEIGIMLRKVARRAGLHVADDDGVSS